LEKYVKCELKVNNLRTRTQRFNGFDSHGIFYVSVDAVELCNKHTTKQGQVT